MKHQHRMTAEKEGIGAIAIILMPTGFVIMVNAINTTVAWDRFLAGLIMLTVGTILWFARGVEKNNRWRYDKT
ncbi:MAG: hypothetical protein AB1779_00825 [Candidatus Thermoplasmatota archaeon]